MANEKKLGVKELRIVLGADILIKEVAMPARYLFNSLMVALLAGLVLSCSTGSPVSETRGPNLASPVTPEMTGQRQVEPEMKADGSSHYLWSFVNVFVDPAEMEFEVIPLRQAEAHWNALRWLEKGPCTNCVALTNIKPSGTGTLLVDVKITHPFDLTNLTGFDVRGIAMFAGTHEFPDSGRTTSDRTAGEGELVSAEGFTSLYNPGTEGSGPSGLQGYMKGKFGTITYPNSTLNGYMRYTSDDPANMRNAFYSGSTITRTYEIDVPSTPFLFGYAVDASWAPPTVKPVTDPMIDFPPEANCPEPWRIQTSATPFHIGLNTQGGIVYLDIQIYDWQGLDSYGQPVVECPELYEGVLFPIWVSAGPGYDLWRVIISNDLLVPAGFYKCLVGVEDDENATSPDWLDLTAYQIADLAVIDWYDAPPVAIGDADPMIVAVNEKVTFSDAGSYDPDGGMIVQIEWDIFNNGAWDHVGDDYQISFVTPGIVQVQMRVTDNDGSTDVLDAPLVVEVTASPVPVAMATADPNPQTVCEPVNFSDDGSYDPDGGLITLYEWDWDDDGTYDEQGESVQHTWNIPGIYYVQLRITDDESMTAELPTPLEIVIANALPTASASAFPMIIKPGASVELDGSGSHDNDCGEESITEWEWDWENDGIFDDSGETTSHAFNSSGLFDVQLRVTDDEGATAVLAAPILITVNNPPMAVASPTDVTTPLDVSVLFSGSDSTDSDGTIVMYEWDWDNDSVFDETGMDVQHEWYAEGLNQVNLRVTDDIGATDDLEALVNVEVRDMGWAATWGGTAYDQAQSVDFDSDGSVYVAGFFSDVADFDPGPELNERTSQGGDDIFLSKFDLNGNLLWVITLGSAGNDWAHDIVLDETNGGVYMAGYFTGTVDFDPGDGIVNASSNGGSIDAFVARFPDSDSLDWVRTWGGPGVDQAMSLDITSNNDIAIVGVIRDTVDIDPNAGVENYTSDGDFDISMTCLDLQGNTVWVQALGGVGVDGAAGVQCDGESLWMTGYFSDTVDFDPGLGLGNETSNGDTDVFLCLYNGNNGGFGGALAWGGPQADMGLGLAMDSWRIYVTGGFRDTVDFNPDQGTVNRTSNGETDAFLSVFAAQTGLLVNVFVWGAGHYDVGRSVCTMQDIVGVDFKTYVTGAYTDTVDFDPSLGIFNITSNGLQDIFVSKFGDSGFETAIGIGGSSNDTGLAVSPYIPTHMLGVVGSYQDSADFDPGAGVDTHNSLGSYDAFCMKLTWDLGW